MEKSRIEWILRYGLGEISTLPPNLSRIEELLVLLIQQGGSGGGGGTTNYDALINKPSIEGNTLQGNKTLSQLGIQSALVFDNVPTVGSSNPVTSSGIATALSGKASTDSIPDLNNYYSKEQTENLIILKIAEIVADAPEDFDTLKEISDWISGHEDSAAAMNSAIQENARKIENKVDKVSGMGLSQNSFTNAEKTKLTGLNNHYDVGNTISGNTDLNDMKTIGSYACPTGAVAASLANCPYKNTGFRLDIFYTSSVNYLKQVLQPNQMGNDSNVYQRTYINSTGEWSPWYKSTSEAVTE